MEVKQKRRTNHEFFLRSFQKSLTVFLKETGLHGLKFIGDSTLSIWERLFFCIAFVVAFVLTCQLISNIYVKWDSTPVIIGISPQAMSILKVPFPAITICNMNQVQRTKVVHYKEQSSESEILKLLCNTDSTEESVDDDMQTQSYNFANNNLRISDFVSNHSQPCEKMLRYCRFGATEFKCVHLFQEIITDEGLCCVFNYLPEEILYKRYSNRRKNLTTDLGYVPVPWDPETGYPAKLPKKYYPHPAIGTGITLGFTAVLDAQLDEYYCSSTNGPGFKVCIRSRERGNFVEYTDNIYEYLKVLFHNPITTPNLKENGLVVGIGYEMNFRLEFSSSEAMPSIRSIARNDRQCIFKNEKELSFYKYYTHINCEYECLSKYLYDLCACIPYNYPHIYNNASVCTIKDTNCVRRAQRPENRFESAKCRKECLPSCFDLSYNADALYFPLAKRNFRIANGHVANMNKSYLLENIAVMNLYYRESAYYGSLKNVYIGLTEFLSNIGGVMGLFMGFSVISLAEMLYFLILKPLLEFIIWKRNGNFIQTKPKTFQRDNSQPINGQMNNIWHVRELYPQGIMTSKITSSQSTK